MKLYAFSDFHLSGQPQTKPMDIFGANWKNHPDKIRTAWLARIRPEDVVIIAGDLSWGRNLKDALPDLQWIAALPGRKIVVRGNHDYWWDTVAKMTRATGGAFEFLHNNTIRVGPIALAGTRSWIPETSKTFTDQDAAILRREEGRLERSIELAEKSGASRIICVLHYPPYDDHRRPMHILSIMKEHGIRDCIFGHIHGEKNFHHIPDELCGVRLHLTSADYLDFKPYLVCEVPDGTETDRKPPSLRLHLRRSRPGRVCVCPGKRARYGRPHGRI